MKAIKHIDIYLVKKRNTRPIDVVQYDTGIQLVFTVKDFDIPSGATATLYVQKPSGKFVYQEKGITVADNTITADLENQAITEHGRVPYQVSLTSGSDVITTFTGVLMVEKSLKDAGAVESKTVISAFEEAVNEQIERILNTTNLFATKNEVANAIKGNLSGSVVFADDVSAVEHNPVVKVVCPDGVDPTTVAVRRCGKNQIRSEKIENKQWKHAPQHTSNGVTWITSDTREIVVQGTTPDGGYSVFDIATGALFTEWLVDGQTYIASLNKIGNGDIEFVIDVINKETGKTEYYIRDGSVFTVDKKKYGYGTFRLQIQPKKTVDAVVRPQIEFGETATAFEPYNGTEHTPSVDGTVSGITSVSPNMTILTDNAGVIVECEYNRDTQKYINSVCGYLVDEVTGTPYVMKVRNGNVVLESVV